MLKADTLILLAVIFAAFFYAAHNEVEAEVARQDTEALASREWAGQQVCGPHATPEWLDDKTLRCLRNLDDGVSVAGGRP